VILGASHITLACADVERGAADLAQIGYKVTFVEPKLPSDRGKFPLLSAPRDIHTLALARGPGGLPIELVDYHMTIPEPCGRFVGLFGMQAAPKGEGEAPPPGMTAAAAEAFGCDVTPGSLPGFGAPALYASSGAGAGLAAALLPVVDIARAKQLWVRGLGFREVARGNDWIRLDRDAPVPAWRFTVTLVNCGERLAPPCLDGRGMTCLAFVCSSIERDCDALTENGAGRVMSPFPARVNGRRMSVEVLRGIDGEFIELIEINR
jgi:hypothetical protein